MEVNRLTQEELVYENVIRGLPTGRVDDMRASLRAALRVEKDGSPLPIDPYPYTFDEDLKALNKKLEEIKSLLGSFQGMYSTPEYAKLRSKIEWSLGRVGRMQAKTEEETKEKARIRGEIVMALASLNVKAKGDLENYSSSDDSVAEVRPRVSLYKWGIKYSGDPGHSLNSFLERVTELADARGVTKGQLFQSALDLFTGKALIWYRANKTSLKCWSDLVIQLKREFLPADYDERLLEEIRRRTQGKEEAIGIYVAMMTNMFSRLMDPLAEEQKLKILKGNIAPFYQTQLGLTQVNSIQELVELGKRLESVRTSVEAFVPPSSRNNQLLEPDLAYVSSTPPSAAPISPSNTTPNPRRCFRCGANGHFARECRQNIRCFRCGMIGVTRHRCPQCNRLNQGNLTPERTASNQTQQMSENGNGARH